MAEGKPVIVGDAAAAMQSFVKAITYLGCNASSNPSRPVESMISGSGYGAPSSGTATVFQMETDQTVSLVEIKLKAALMTISLAASSEVIVQGGAPLRMRKPS